MVERPSRHGIRAGCARSGGSSRKARRIAEQVRLGFVGCGRWGSILAQAAQRSGRAVVAGGYARTETTRRAFAEAFACRPASSLDDLLASYVDGVVVVTPHRTHLDLVTAAAEAGKHVLVEKPLTVDVRSATAAVEAAERAGVVLQVGHQRRRLAANRALHRLVVGGELGTVHLLEATLAVPVGLNPAPGWRTDPDERPLGGMTGFGVHMIDTLQYLAGPARRVSAFSKPLLARSPLDDVTTLCIEYESGPLATLATTLVTPKVATVTAYGTQGCAWSEEDGERLFRQGVPDTSRHEVPVEPVDVLAEQFAEFADCVQGVRTPEVGGGEGLEVVAVLEAAIRSVERGCAVDLAEMRPTPRPGG